MPAFRDPMIAGDDYVCGFRQKIRGSASGEICGLLLFTYAPKMESRDMDLYLLQCHIRSVFLVTSLSFQDFPGVAIDVRPCPAREEKNVKASAKFTCFTGTNFRVRSKSDERALELLLSFALDKAGMYISNNDNGCSGSAGCNAHYMSE
jgi:hypothetical protein